MSTGPFKRRVALAAARAALVWERAVKVWWPALAFPAAFTVLALFGLWTRIGDPWRGAALTAALVLAAVTAWRGWRAGPWPTAHDVQRRVEQDSGLAGRPFEALNDTPVSADPNARALWRAHRDRMERELGAARARRPHAALAARDVFALRGVLALGAVAGLVAAGASAPSRISDAFAPGWLDARIHALEVQAWIAPPEYTRRAPIFLRASAEDAIEVPAGSELVVRIIGARRAPRLLLETDDGKRRRLSFEPDGPGAYAAHEVLETDALVTVADQSWRLRAITDTAPGAAFAEGPEPGAHQELSFTYLLQDDYGITSAALRITLQEEPDAEATSETDDVVSLERTLDTAPGVRSVEERTHMDFTEHPWAGREVEIRLVAIDALGQEGLSEPVFLTLPERVFVDPLARAIVEQRNALVLEVSAYAPLADTPPLTAADAAARPSVQTDQTRQRLGRAPTGVQQAKRALDLMRIGAPHFEDDAAVHLALSYAANRLTLAREREDLDDLPQFLWDTALRAEGGDLADAERALRQAERALARALARGDTPAQIEGLLDQYREAVNRYTDLLRLEALRDGRVVTDFAGGGGAGMNVDDLQAMLQALRDLAETGSNDDARRMLAALTELLRNMEMTLAMGGQGGEGPPQSPMSQALREALEDLAEVLGQQRETMDDTQLAESGAQPEGSPDGAGEDGAASDAPGSDAGPSGEDQGGESQGGRSPNNTAGNGPQQDGAPGSGSSYSQLRDEQRAVRDALHAFIGELKNNETLANGVGAEETDDAIRRAEDALKYADRAMERAEDALDDEEGGSALFQQGRALEALREGLEALADGAIRAELGANSNGEGAPGDANSRDPFGRNASGGGFDAGDSVNVPDEMERRRAREILEELRRRSGEAERSEDELDYFRRLLERF